MANTGINRSTANVALPKEVSDEIWAATVESSAIMELARQLPLPGTGVTIQTITGEPEADWVNESAAKPVSTHTFGKKGLTPYKLAVIEPFSMEFTRDVDALYAECVRRLPYALAKKFDQTVLGTTAPGENFDTLGDCTKQTIKGDAYAAFIAADAAISAADGIMTGVALAPQGKSIVLAARTTDGLPLFTPGVGSNTVGNILGATTTVKKSLFVSGSPNIVGIAGDFDDAVYGTVEGVQMSISDQATLTTSDGTINLWQQNMVAVRYEIEVGFAVKDKAEFILLTDEAA